MLAVNHLVAFVVVFYVVAFAIHLVHFARRARGRTNAGLLALGAGAICHFTLTLQLGRLHGHMPLTSVWESLSIIALTLVAVDIYLQLRTKIASVSVFVVGAALLIQLVASTGLAPSFESKSILRGGWFVLHSSTTIAGYSAFAISGLLAALHLLQRRQIRRRKLGVIHSRLPSLGVLDRLSGHAALAGLVLLTIGIVSGSIFANQVWGTYWSWDPKQVSAAAVWLVYGVYAVLRLGAGWSGPRLAVLSLLGLGCFVFTFLGVHVLFSTLHDFL